MKQDIKKMIDIMGNAALSNLCHIECDIDTNFDNECSLCRQATALHEAGYRKQSDTVKEFAEKLKTELFANCVVIQTISNPQKEDMDSSEAFQIIDELAEQYGKERVNTKIYVETTLTKFPDNCWKCKCWHYEGRDMLVTPICQNGERVNLTSKTRPDWCPLVEAEDKEEV